MACNVQTAVDSKHHLIVAQDVTNDITDRDQLSRTGVEAKETLDVRQIKAVTDMGYAHGKELKACLEAGIEPYVLWPDTSANAKLGLFGKEQFVYDPDTDTYRCPTGQTLTYRFDTVEGEKGRSWHQAHSARPGTYHRSPETRNPSTVRGIGRSKACVLKRQTASGIGGLSTRATGTVSVNEGV